MQYPFLLVQSKKKARHYHTLAKWQVSLTSWKKKSATSFLPLFFFFSCYKTIFFICLYWLNIFPYYFYTYIQQYIFIFHFIKRLKFVKGRKKKLISVSKSEIFIHLFYKLKFFQLSNFFICFIFYLNRKIFYKVVNFYIFLILFLLLFWHYRHFSHLRFN